MITIHEYYPSNKRPMFELKKVQYATGCDLIHNLSDLAPDRTIILTDNDNEFQHIWWGDDIDVQEVLNAVEDIYC